MEIYLDMYQTITVAVLVLMLGKVLKKKFGILERWSDYVPVQFRWLAVTVRQVHLARCWRILVLWVQQHFVRQVQHLV